MALAFDVQSDDLFDLIEQITNADKLFDGHEILRRALQDFGLEHVSYAAMNLPTERHSGALVAVTYSADWQKHYVQQRYVDLDPVVRAGIGGILPVNWADLDRKDPFVRKFFGEAQEFNVGQQGLSFPIRGKLNEFAILSLTSDMDDLEWSKVKQRYMREFMLLAYHFHAWALKAENIDLAEFGGRLSHRETECLRWRALGKSDWDISQILGISERTVKFHLENARGKLGAMNTIHAVSKALSLNLITLV